MLATKNIKSKEFKLKAIDTIIAMDNDKLNK